jgi:hypothetical protein
MPPQCYSRRTAQILSADNREHEVAGTALNWLFLIEAMRARHWKGPSPYRAPCAVKSWPIGLPEADDGADRDGDRNRDQNPEQDREKDGQGEGLSNFADPADLASPPRTVLGERIRFDGARLAELRMIFET